MTLTERAESASAEQRLLSALAKIMPIKVFDGRDYAEVYFADDVAHKTQAMTMNPQHWLDLQEAYDAILRASEDV